MGGQTGEIRGKEGMQIGKAGIRKEEGELLTTHRKWRSAADTEF